MTKPGGAVRLLQKRHRVQKHDNETQKNRTGKRNLQQPSRKGRNMQEYETLKQLVASAEEDIIKAEGGNKAAGTRIRKLMQEVKQAAQQVRIKILEQRSGN